jgi:hypothetical protein
MSTSAELQIRRRALGIEGWGTGENDSDVYYPDPIGKSDAGIVFSPGASGPSPLGAAVPALLAGIIKTVGDIFKPPQVSIAQANAGAAAQYAAQYASQNQARYQTQYGTPPAGYQYNSSGALVKQSVGNVTNFVTGNPLLVGGLVLFTIVLFIKPPGRR